MYSPRSSKDSSIINLNAHFENILSQFLSAYTKHFSTQHFVLRIVENWKLHLDNNIIVGAILMDLSKAFDCLPHELIIAKLAAYGLGKEHYKYF